MDRPGVALLRNTLSKYKDSFGQGISPFLCRLTHSGTGSSGKKDSASALLLDRQFTLEHCFLCVL